MHALLAIDQSTSATKALLFDTAGRLLDRAAREHRQFYPSPGYVEQDAEEIWRNLIAVAGEVLARAWFRHGFAYAPFALFWVWVLAMSILLLAGRLTARADQPGLA